MLGLVDRDTVQDPELAQIKDTKDAVVLMRRERVVGAVKDDKFWKVSQFQDFCEVTNCVVVKV